MENNKDVSCQVDGSAMECPVTESREEQTEASSCGVSLKAAAEMDNLSFGFFKFLCSKGILKH